MIPLIKSINSIQYFKKNIIKEEKVWEYKKYRSLSDVVSLKNYYEQTEKIYKDIDRESEIMKITVTNDLNEEKNIIIRDYKTFPCLDLTQTDYNLYYHNNSLSLEFFSWLFVPVTFPYYLFRFILSKLRKMDKETYLFYKSLLKTGMFTKEEKEIIKKSCINMNVEQKKNMKELE